MSQLIKELHDLVVKLQAIQNPEYSVIQAIAHIKQAIGLLTFWNDDNERKNK